MEKEKQCEKVIEDFSKLNLKITNKLKVEVSKLQKNSIARKYDNKLNSIIN